VATITINGLTITGGRNVSIQNGRVIVDGTDVTPESKQINISINGNVERLEADACQKITITGDVGAVKTMSGDVDVTGAISGSVKTMSGNVDCGGSIAGSVSTMSGDIKQR
jgi:DUF4097 and DUF4098 domain-containing protein YvlB